MTKQLFFVLALIVSLESSAMMVENQSNTDVIFKTSEAMIIIEPSSCAEISLEIMNQFYFTCLSGGSSLYRMGFRKFSDDESQAEFVNGNEHGFLSIDREPILFKLEMIGKVREFSCYEKMIIKQADPNVFEGLSVTLQRHLSQKIKDAVDISGWKCNIL